jgi:hypothetical protein
VAALATSHRRLCFGRKASSIVSVSSVGLVGDAFGASSVTTRSTHAVRPPGASGVVVRSCRAFFSARFPTSRPALRTLVLVHRMHVLLASGAALRSLSLVVHRRPRVGLSSCATCRRLQHRCEGPPQGVARSSIVNASLVSRFQ